MALSKASRQLIAKGWMFGPDSTYGKVNKYDGAQATSPRAFPLANANKNNKFTRGRVTPIPNSRQGRFSGRYT